MSENLSSVAYRKLSEICPCNCPSTGYLLPQNIFFLGKPELSQSATIQQGITDAVTTGFMRKSHQ